MIRHVLFAAMLCVLIPPAVEGQTQPFGLRMGMTAEEVQRITGATPVQGSVSLFKSARVPQPHTEFELYYFTVVPGIGLCKISGAGVTIENDAYGNELRRRFESLETALDGKYGRHKRFDFLHAGSIWSEPREWTKSLEQKERSFISYWDEEENGGPLPAPVEGVTLETLGLSGNSGWLRLVYEFTNIKQCFAEIARLKNAGL